tara:strand:+ start:233 stop:1447 length:1215 start_codon:yes stop_codon:yes gene_type:complete
MLAPEPFFQPRGTPFSEYHRIKVLAELGYQIDLVTYPFGRDVDLPNLRIFRCGKPPFIRKVSIGPSLVKVILDVFLCATAFQRTRLQEYDAIHSHEEAGFLGVWLARWLKIPHLYDMHSSLPQQLTNFRYAQSKGVKRLFEWLESKMIKESRVVITICEELQAAVVAAGAGERAHLIENSMGGDMDGAVTDLVDVRSNFNIEPSQPIILYTGTFEAYQGLEMFLEAAGQLARTHPQIRCLIVGGEPVQVDAARSLVGSENKTIIFTGQRRPEEIPSFVEAADILVSPRISGTNTPLKIYSYLRSGRPIVATKLRTHTQVLNPEAAILVEPEPEAFAKAIGHLLDHPADGKRIARAARLLSDERYSREIFVCRTAAAYKQLFAQPSSDNCGTSSRQQSSAESKLS